MSDYTKTFKAACVQAEPVLLDLDASIDKTIALIGQAAGNGAQLIAFPETWLPGYPWWIWLDSPAWGMQFVARYHDNSLDAAARPQFDRITAAAAEHGIAVVLGYSERVGGSLYMGQALIARPRRDRAAHPPQAQAHPRRAHGVRRGRRLRPRGARHRARPARRACAAGSTCSR